MFPHDNDDDKDPTPIIFNIILSHEEMKDLPNLMMVINTLMSQLIVDEDEHYDEPELDDICYAHVAVEMQKLDAIDHIVQGDYYPDMEQLILNAWKTHKHEG